MVALHDVNHDEMVLVEPDAMLRLSNAFIAWANGVSPELIGDGAKGSAAQACQQNRKISFVSSTCEDIDVGKKVLFVCSHNSARSQIAEAFLRTFFEVDESLHWAIHFAAILGPLDEGETHLVSALNEAIPMLPRMRREVGSIDYGSFELQGDYRELCQRRHALFLGERTSRSSPS